LQVGGNPAYEYSEVLSTMILGTDAKAITRSTSMM